MNRRWHLVKSEGRTVYHRRHLTPGDAWCSVKSDGRRWEWAVPVRVPGEVSGKRKADGFCSTWQNARSAADKAAAKLGLS